MKRALLTMAGFFAPLLMAWPAYAPPPMLDHFTCYPIRETTSVNEFVELQDQFAFCNPVEKLRDGQTTPIQIRNDHLTCYVFRTADPSAKPAVLVRTDNQFGREKVFVTQARYLCVPTAKQVVSP